MSQKSESGPRVQMQDAKALSQGYVGWYRKVEVLGILTFWALVGGQVWKAWPWAQKAPWVTVAALVFGYLLADFTSGFVHWLFDTWGTTQTPVLGQTVIRPFREHHVDEKAMTKHDYIETNGANCIVAVPFAAGSLLIPLDIPGWEAFGLFWLVSMGSMVFWVMLTNQFHKWSHLDEKDMPPLLPTLQKLHLVLPPEHHQVHHKAPFTTYYCITTGWLNWPLQAIGFYRGMEKVVTALTGAVPRENDIGLEAALAAAPMKPIEPSPEPQVDLSRP